MVALPFFEIALVLVRLDYVARFITKPLTTIRPLLYTLRYDYQISCAHFSNRHCEHFCCASSITRPSRVASGITFAREKTSHAQKA